MSIQGELLGTYSSLIGLLNQKKAPKEAPAQVAKVTAPALTPAPAGETDISNPTQATEPASAATVVQPSGVDTRDKDPAQMNEMRGRADRSLTGYQAQVRETRKRYGRALEKKGVKI